MKASGFSFGIETRGDIVENEINYPRLSALVLLNHLVTTDYIHIFLPGIQHTNLEYLLIIISLFLLE